MATIDQLREVFGGASDAETIQLASEKLGLDPVHIADEVGFGSTGGKNKQRMSASVDRYQAGLYGVGEAAANAAGLTGVGNFMGSRRRSNEIEANIASTRAQQQGAVDSFKDVHSLGDFGDYAVGLGIQSLPYMGEALAGGIAGRAVIGGVRGGLAGAAVGSYPSSVGDILSNQREQNGQTDLLSAAALGVPYAAANIVGVEGALARGQLFRNGISALDNVKGFRGGLARAGTTAGTTAVSEGASEAFQEGMNQLGRMAVDPRETFFNEKSNERFTESFIGGATLGGLMGGGLGGWRRSEHYNAPANLLPDAAPQTDRTFNPGSITNTPVTDMPGFGSQPQDPLQQRISPIGTGTDTGPSVNINPNAALTRTATGNVAANPPSNPQTGSTRKQPNDEPPATPQERQAANEMYRTETVLDDGTEEGHWRVFGKDFFKRTELNKALDKQAQEDRGDDAGMTQLAKQLNAAGPAFLRPKALKELATSLVGSTPEKTAYNLNAAIAGGHKEADRLAAVYEEITGKESPAWKALQESEKKPEEKPAPAPAAAPAPAPQTTAATQPETKFEEDDFEGMARATLMKLFNNNERSVEIALADLRGDKPADIQKAYGISDSLVRKLRDAYTAPKRLELAAKQAGVPLDKLQAALAKRAEAQPDTVVPEEEGTSKKITTSDDRPLAQAPDEELSGDQKKSDAMGTAGMTVSDNLGTQIADASSRNNSRSKLNKAKGNLQSRSLTLADLNNLYEEEVSKETAEGDAAAEKIVAEVERRHRNKLFDEADQVEVDQAVHEGEANEPDETRNAVPAGAKNAGGTVRQEARPASSAPGKAGKKEPKGKVGTAWDKLHKQLSAAKVEMPAWESLTPEQKIKATDQLALNGKIGVEQAQKVLGTSGVAPPPPKPKIDEKSAATVAKTKVQRSTAPSQKETSGSDLMAKLNAAAEAKKRNPNLHSIVGRSDREKIFDLQRIKPEPQEGDLIRLNLPWVPGGYEVDALVGKTSYQDKHGRVVDKEADGAQRVIEVHYKVNGEQINNSFDPQQLRLNTVKFLEKPNLHPIYGGSKSVSENTDREFKTSRLEQLTTALDMDQAGVDPEKIRLATGWFRGPHDKKWRYEIADNGADLMPAWHSLEESKLFGQAVTAKLGDILHHPKLFDAYPEAKNIDVVKRKGLFDFGGLQGWFNGKNEIGITPYAKNPLSTLLHEVQHWIQQQEGFATGGNEDSAFASLTPAQKKRFAMKLVPKLEERVKREENDLRSLKLAKEIILWPETAMSREAHGKWDVAYKMPDGEARDKAKEEAFTAIDEADRVVRDRFAQEFGHGPTESWEWMAITQARRNSLAELITRITDAEKQIVAAQKDLASIRSGDETALTDIIKKSGQGHALYKAIAGEIEARDTQHRQQMTDEERKQYPPFTAEKFDPEDVITTFDKDNRSEMTGNGIPKVNLPRIDNLRASYGHAELMDLGEGDRTVTVVDDHEAFFRAHPVVGGAFALLDKHNLAHVLDGISEIDIVEGQYVVGQGLAAFGDIGNGEKALYIAGDHLDNSNDLDLAFSIMHELGHAVDLMHTHAGDLRGRYSSRAELMFGKGIRPFGTAAQDMRMMFDGQTEHEWEFFGYPLDGSYNLDKGQLHNEAFAQLFAAYIMFPKEFKNDAPRAAKFIEGVIKDAQQVDFEQEARDAVEGYERHTLRPDSVKRPGGDVQRRTGSLRQVTADGTRASDGATAQGGRQRSTQAGRRQAERLIESLPQASRSGARRLWTTIADAAKKGLFGAAFTWDLADIAARQLPSVTKYMDLMGKKGAVKNHLEDAIEKILAQSERVAKTDRLGRAQTGTGEHSINKFLYDSTVEGKWGYKDDAASGIKVDPEMERRFQNFTPDAQALIKSILRHGTDTLRMKQRIIKEEINNEFRALLKEAENDPEKLEELERKRRAALQHYDSILLLTHGKPYVPLRRFGNYVVVARSQQFRDAMANNNTKGIERMQADEDHYFVAFYETLGQAEEQANRLQATGKYAEASAFEKEKGLDAIHNGRDMLTAFQRLRNLIKSELEADPRDKLAQSLNGMISDLYLQTLAETSARKAEIKRRNVAGADKDMLRAFATQGRADAHFIAALKHNGDVTDAIYEMRREAHEGGPGKADKMRLFNEFMQRHALHMNYQEHRVQDAITRATSLWMLATSPAYYLQNATQTPMISIPWLAGKHGYGRSWAAWTQAMKDLGPMSEGVSLSDRMDFSKAPADVRRMLDDLVAAGRIDIALDQDLGRFRSDADNALGKTWNSVDRKLRGMQQRVEAINRVTTAIAAYRMELAKNGGNHAAATEYASKAIRVTHGDYSAFNTPRYLSPGGGLPAAKVIGQFRKFQIIQASLIARLFNNAFTGDVSPEERAVARKALAFTLGHTAAMGGFYGLPGASTLAWLVAKLLSDPDEPDDDELMLRRAIGNQDMADLILKGAPAYFGLDLSGKLGMGNAFSILPYARITGMNRDTYKEALLGVTGPFVGGLLPRMIDGVNLIGQGDWYKGLEMMVPSGFGNAMKGYRFAEEGVTKRNGDLMMDADEVTTATAMAQAMGLQTKQLTDRTFDQKVVAEFEQFFKEKATRLEQKYAKASKSSDTQAMADLREEWMQLQESRVRNGFQRQPLSTLLKAPVSQAKREREAVNHVGANRNTRALARELEGI